MTTSASNEASDRRPVVDVAIPNIGSWTEERTERLVLLWEEGVSTAEMGRRLGVSKSAIIGKVHRIGLTPRVIVRPYREREILRNVFDFTGPVCMWPHGHPGDDDFRFCGGRPLAGKPYCSRHSAIAYLRPKKEEGKAAAD